MGKHKHRSASRADAPSAPITAPTNPPPVGAHQEKTMDTAQEKTPAALPETAGPTAKEMAAVEEINSARLKKLAEQADMEPMARTVPVADVAARGYDALHEAFANHNANAAKRKEYVPPPRTARQMAALEEELEAGRRAQQRAEAQQAASRPDPTDQRNEGFTTPVYRPRDAVPDPVTGKLGSFSPDA